MRILVKLAAVLSVAVALFAVPANAQTTPSLDATTSASLNAALAAGDVTSVMLIVDSKKGDAASTQAIAAILLASAQSIQATDPGGAGILAAIALVSGGLQGTAATAATSLVNTSGNAIANAIIAFSNAGIPPSVIANALLVGIIINPVQVAQNVAANPTQSGSIQ